MRRSKASPARDACESGDRSGEFESLDAEAAAYCRRRHAAGRTLPITREYTAAEAAYFDALREMATAIDADRLRAEEEPCEAAGAESGEQATAPRPPVAHAAPTTSRTARSARRATIPAAAVMRAVTGGAVCISRVPLVLDLGSEMIAAARHAGPDGARWLDRHPELSLTAEVLAAVCSASGYAVDETLLDRVLAAHPLRDASRREDFRCALGNAIGRSLALARRPTLIAEATRKQVLCRLASERRRIERSGSVAASGETTGAERAILRRHGVGVHDLGAASEVATGLDCARRWIESHGDRWVGRGPKTKLVAWFAVELLCDVFVEFVGEPRRNFVRDRDEYPFLAFVSAALDGTPFHAELLSGSGVVRGVLERRAEAARETRAHAAD